jgi:hypothetical protein
MANLIEAFTDYEVAEWDEKDWLANKASTSSSQKVIFLGDSKEAKKRHLGMTWAYNQLNMKYGWLGNQCIVDIDPLSADSIKGFCEYYQSKAIEYEARTEQPTLRLPGEVLREEVPNSDETVEVLEVEVSPSKNPLERAAYTIQKFTGDRKTDLSKIRADAIAPINNQIAKSKLIRFQYNLLIREFIFTEGLKDFMES